MEKLRIAIQKSGRLSEKSLELLKEAGISLNNGSRKLKSLAQVFPLEVIYLRDDDIRGLQDAGEQSRPPAAYEEQFNAYKKGAARSSRGP